jgi:uncharacterized protein
VEMMNKETRSYKVTTPFEIRDLGNGVLQCSGYCIRFNEQSVNLGGFVEQVAPTALTRTLRESPDVLLLRDHDTSKLLARTKAGSLTLTTDSQGLRFSATLQPTTTAKDTWLDLKAGLLDACSFGFSTVADEWSQTSDGTPLRTLLDIDLYEASVCSFAAYPTTSAEARSRAQAFAAQMSRDDDPSDPDAQDDLQGIVNDVGDDNDDDDDNDDLDLRCSCRCIRCRMRDCYNCAETRCTDAGCRSNGCPMPGNDEARADALRMNQYFHSLKANQPG